MFRKTKHEPEQLGLDELLQKKRALDLEIAGRQDKEIESLKAKVNAVADALGISVLELFAIKPGQPERRKKRRASIKFRDPDHPENTWTGKGHPPKWLQDKIQHGAPKEEFLVT